MVHENLVYNPLTDVQPVDQFGFIDLVKAKETGTIPANISGVEVDYNGVDDPSSLLNRPADQFEAMRQVKRISAAKKAVAESNGEAVTSGDPE